MPNRKKTLKVALLTVAVLVIIVGAAAFLGTLYLNAQAPHYRQLLAQRMSQQLDTPVTIRKLALRWHWQGPALHLTRVRIRGEDNTLHIPAVGLQFSLLDLLRGRRLPSGVIVHRPHIDITADTAHARNPVERLSQWLAQRDWQRLDAIRRIVDDVTIENAGVTVQSAKHADRPLLRLHEVRATLHSQDDSLVIRAHARGHDKLDSIHLKARLHGHLPNIDTAELSLNLHGLAPLQLRRQPGAWQSGSDLTGGRTDMQLEARWQDHDFRNADLSVRTRAIRAPGTDHPVVPRLSARLTALPDDNNADEIHVSLTSLQSPAIQTQSIRASARVNWRQPAIDVQARQLPTTLLAPALQHLTGLDVTLDGQFKAVDFSVGIDQSPRLALAFNDLAVQTPDFSVGRLDGHIYRHDGTNVLQLTGANGHFSAPGLVRGRIPLQQANGQITWQTTDDGIRARLDDLHVDNSAAAITLNGSLLLPDGSPPVADLSLHGTTPDCSIPLSRIPHAEHPPFDDLRNWLRTAITAGDVVVDGYLKGPIDKIFDDDGKHFGLTMTGSGFAMTYKPGWPALTDVSGSVRLRGAAMAIDIPKGRMLGVDVGPVVMHIDDVRDPVLHLDGSVKDGSAHRMLSFLAKSPLQDRFGKLVEVLDLKGTAGLDLALRIPLDDGLGDTEVSGVIHADDNEIDHAALPAPIKHVRGDIHFDDDGLSARNLHGQLAGVDLSAEITPGQDGSSRITSRAVVRLPEDNELLTHYLPDNWLSLAHGQSPVTVSLDIDQAGHIADLTLDSSLEGMALALPEPLGKAAAEQKPLHLNLPNDGPLGITLGQSARAQLHFDESDDLQRAVLQLGQPIDTRPPEGRGIWLSGQMQSLPVKQWFDVLSSMQADPDQQSAHSLPFLGADLAVAKLHVGRREIDSVDMHVRPRTDGAGWTLHTDSPHAAGKAVWLPALDTLRARFSRLHVKTNKPPDTADHETGPPGSTLTDADPREFPALDLQVARLQVDAVDYGTATLKTTRQDDGLTLAQADLSGGKLTLQASGDWTRHVGLTGAHLDFHIKGQSLTPLTRLLGLTLPIRADAVSAQGQLHFRPDDHGLDLAALDGTLRMRLDDGVVLSVDPGVSRLFGLFNLHALPRRLLLDFSDVVDKGMAFDRIAGGFTINNGNAFTDDMQVQTPAAKIGIVGRIGLAARDYDQTVTVTPKIGSGLTIAGAVLGGPVVGVGIFALQEMLGLPLQNASGVTYELHGSWRHPEIVDPQRKD